MNKVETYRSVEKLIRKIVCEHIKKHGGVFDDLFQEAYLAFDKAYETHDGELAAMTTHVSWKVRYALLDYYRKHCKHFARESQVEVDDEQPLEAVDDFNPCYIVDYIDSLGVDARLVLESVLTQKLHNITAIRKFFKKDWTQAKVNSAIHELQGELAC